MNNNLFKMACFRRLNQNAGFYIFLSRKIQTANQMVDAIGHKHCVYTPKKLAFDHIIDGLHPSRHQTSYG